MYLGSVLAVSRLKKSIAQVAIVLFISGLCTPHAVARDQQAEGLMFFLGLANALKSGIEESENKVYRELLDCQMGSLQVSQVISDSVNPDFAFSPFKGDRIPLENIEASLPIIVKDQLIRSKTIDPKFLTNREKIKVKIHEVGGNGLEESQRWIHVAIDDVTYGYIYDSTTNSIVTKTRTPILNGSPALATCTAQRVDELRASIEEFKNKDNKQETAASQFRENTENEETQIQ